MTNISFEQSLEHCLRELIRTGDVKASLRSYRQHTDRLRPLLEMAQVTRRYYEAVPESPGGLIAGRERLLAVAAQQRARGVGTISATRTVNTRTAGRKMRLIFATRLITVLLVVAVGMATLGGGVLWAAGDSLPGGLLYPTKLAMEDTRLALTSAPADQVDLALQLVQERAEEMQALVVARRQVPDETVARMEQHIERALTQAAWASDEEITGLLTQITECTRSQAQVLEQVQATVPPQTQPGLEHAVTICQRGAEAAGKGLDDPRAFRRCYRYQRGGCPEPAAGTPEPTKETEQVTTTPGGDQEQDQEHPRTPVGTPYMMDHEPQATPHGPWATPHRHQETPIPPTTTLQPQYPDSGQGEGGQDGGEHDNAGGQDDGKQNDGGQDDGEQDDGRQGGGEHNDGGQDDGEQDDGGQEGGEHDDGGQGDGEHNNGGQDS
ncbi:MAG: DUF5667 domain-containing protein [Chloroflexota bacterium]|nr:DUF5667 domain-containing protein [Chloroflexota bacterium]